MRNSSCTVPTTLHPRPPVSQPNSAGTQSPQGVLRRKLPVQSTILARTPLQLSLSF